MTRSKDIGTQAESAVVKALRVNGFPHAERRALHGSTDLGDVTGCPLIVFEVKGGQAARTASDGQVTAWLAETEIERVNAAADFGVLVLQRAGIGPANADRWWAVMPSGPVVRMADTRAPIWMHLSTACALLRSWGYGTTITAGTA